MLNITLESEVKEKCRKTPPDSSFLVEGKQRILMQTHGGEKRPARSDKSSNTLISSVTDPPKLQVDKRGGGNKRENPRKPDFLYTLNLFLEGLEFLFQ